MTIALFRDLVIIVLGIIATGAFILFIIFAYSLYRRLSRTLESLETASSAFQQVCSYATEPLTQPLNLLNSLFQGVRQGLDGINKVFQKGSEQ